MRDETSVVQLEVLCDIKKCVEMELEPYIQFSLFCISMSDLLLVTLSQFPYL